MLNRFCSVPVAMFCAAFMAATGVGSSAYGQVFANNAPIAIPAFGNALPYPSTITVAGGPASIGNFVVTLRGFSHTFPGDVQVLLVAPSGQAVQLMNQNGGSTDAVNLTLGFSNTAGLPLPAPLVSGTYAASGGSFAFATPAPAPPFLPGLASFAGGNSNGVWRLFVNDFVAPDSGSFAGGWSIEFAEPSTPIAPTTFTYQGKLTGGATDGTIDARFTVFDNLTSTSPLNRVGAVSTATGVALIDGVFTAPVNPGVVLPGDRRTWLQVEIANPSGSAFVALTPRQPITPTPLTAVTLDYSAGLLLGSSAVVGNQHATANQGGKSRFGYALNASGTNEFLGMQPIVMPGTAGCGNSGDLTFFTWECNTSTSREIMRINGSGNVGIGTAAPAAKLDVRGSIAMGDSAQYRAAAGTEDLRLLRGTINADGSVNAGAGFTVTPLATGVYTITFATPFSAAPSVSANALSQTLPLTVTMTNVLATQVTYLVRTGAGTATAAPVSFTVMGPR